MELKEYERSNKEHRNILNEQLRKVHINQRTIVLNYETRIEECYKVREENNSNLICVDEELFIFNFGGDEDNAFQIDLVSFKVVSRSGNMELQAKINKDVEFFMDFLSNQVKKRIPRYLFLLQFLMTLHISPLSSKQFFYYPTITDFNFIIFPILKHSLLYHSNFSSIESSQILFQLKTWSKSSKTSISSRDPNWFLPIEEWIYKYCWECVPPSSKQIQHLLLSFFPVWFHKKQIHPFLNPLFASLLPSSSSSSSLLPLNTEKIKTVNYPSEDSDNYTGYISIPDHLILHYLHISASGKSTKNTSIIIGDDKFNNPYDFRRIYLISLINPLSNLRVYSTFQQIKTLTKQNQTEIKEVEIPKWMSKYLGTNDLILRTEEKTIKKCKKLSMTVDKGFNKDEEWMTNKFVKYPFIWKGLDIVFQDSNQKEWRVRIDEIEPKDEVVSMIDTIVDVEIREEGNKEQIIGEKGIEGAVVEKGRKVGRLEEKQTNQNEMQSLNEDGEKMKVCEMCSRLVSENNWIIHRAVCQRQKSKPQNEGNEENEKKKEQEEKKKQEQEDQKRQKEEEEENQREKKKKQDEKEKQKKREEEDKKRQEQSLMFSFFNESNKFEGLDDDEMIHFRGGTTEISSSRNSGGRGTTNNNSNNLMCEKCGEAFGQFDDLMVHQLTIHFEE